MLAYDPFGREPMDSKIQWIEHPRHGDSFDEATPGTEVCRSRHRSRPSDLSPYRRFFSQGPTTTLLPMSRSYGSSHAAGGATSRVLGLGTRFVDNNSSSSVVSTGTAINTTLDTFPADSIQL